MGEIDDEPLIHEADFQPEPDVFRIYVSKKNRPSTRNGEPIRVDYWEGCWDIPSGLRASDDTRKRPQITASSTVSPADAEAKCRDKVFQFWMDRADGIRRETYRHEPARLTKEQRAAGYTVKSFLEEWAASKSNPNTAPANRWRTNTERNNRTMLTKWIYPFLGSIPLTQLTHEQVRIHFTETLPSVMDDNDQRLLGDKRIRGIYSTFRAGMNRAGAKGLVKAGEFLDIGITMTFEPAGVPEDIDHLMWEMNALLQRPEVIEDPLALRWALAYGQGLRRGERCGLMFDDIDFEAGKMNVKRQMTYVPGTGDFLDERLKANEARRIDITNITRPYLEAAKKRRDERIQAGTWRTSREEFTDLVLTRDDGTVENLNHDNALFHEFLTKYGIEYRNVSPGALRHACATYWANYGGEDGRGVSRENLRNFLGHSPDSKLDAYYARSSEIAMTREFGSAPITRPDNARSNRSARS